MNTKNKPQVDHRPPKHLRTLKFGDIREDGKIFWAYHKGCTNGEWWMTKEQFEEYRNKHRPLKPKRPKKPKVDNRPPKHLRTLKQGTKREDGMIFWGYRNYRPNGELWITPKQFKERREAINKRQRENDNRPPPELRVLTKGDVREDGMIFFCYKKGSPNGEWWMTKESYEDQHKKNASKRLKSHIKTRQDPLQRMINSQRSRISITIKNAIKSDKTMNLVGCTPNELRDHLESQFKDGMTFDNYGRGGWHIDHMKPCASFDLSDPEQQRECFHYTNLQPLWEKENLIKGSKIT